MGIDGIQSSDQKFSIQIFVPTYHGNNMEMVRLHSMSDYESLPLTKWHIKQPVFGEKGRENALETGKELITKLLEEQITIGHHRLAGHLNYTHLVTCVVWPS